MCWSIDTPAVTSDGQTITGISRMKSSIICVAIFVTVAALLQSTHGEERCASHLCVPTNRCVTLAQFGTCQTKGHSCCREIRRQDRTQCRHFGGECVNTKCNNRLIVQRVQDCKSGEVCCILV